MSPELAEKVLQAVIDQNDARPCDIALAVLLNRALHDIAALQAELGDLRRQMSEMAVTA